VLSLREPGADTLERLLTEQQRASLSYPEVGATANALPPGYSHDRYEVKVGVGEVSFQRAADGLRNWKAHRGAGVAVYPSGAPLAKGTTVVLVIGIAMVRAIAACRIVYVVDEPNRFGFAYGTLALHPEQGEESFVVEHDTDDTVWFRITAFSRPHDAIARLGSPVARAVQRQVTNAYLRSLERYVA